MHRLVYDQQVIEFEYLSEYDISVKENDLYNKLCLYLPLTLPLSLFLSLFISLSTPLSISLYLLPYLLLSPSLSISLSVTLTIFLSLYLHLFCSVSYIYSLSSVTIFSLEVKRYALELRDVTSRYVRTSSLISHIDIQIIFVSFFLYLHSFLSFIPLFSCPSYFSQYYYFSNHDCFSSNFYFTIE